MGLKERRLREQGQLKEDIMDVTIELAESNGWSSVSIRKIADRIEYSTQKIYELFSSKDDLILSLMRRGIAHLAKVMKEISNSFEDPKECIYAMAESYCKFAWEHETLYRIMYGLDGVHFGVKETRPEGMEVGYIICDILQQLYPNLPRKELVNEVGMMWGSMHGIIALTMAGRIFGGKEQAELLIQQSVDTVLKSHA